MSPRTPQVRRFEGYWHYGYGKDFNAGTEMMLTEIAPRIADLYELGLDHLSLDGNEAALLEHDAMAASAFAGKNLRRVDR